MDSGKKLLLIKKGSSDSTITMKKTSGSITNVMMKDSQKSFASDSEKKIFRAPPGVIPYHVKWSTVRRKSDNQRLIFVWPQNTQIRPNYLTWFVPFVRRILIGLMFVGTLNLWPGEFLPTSIRLTKPIAKPPLRCSNIIEPLWEDDDKDR